jgi:hypothetical protein
MPGPFSFNEQLTLRKREADAEAEDVVEQAAEELASYTRGGALGSSHWEHLEDSPCPCGAWSL